VALGELMNGIRFALNRTCSPDKSLTEFIALAKAAGVDAIEVRNDIPGREFSDGTKAEDLRAMLDDAGLRLASINALQRFNDWDSDRESEAVSLARYAAALGAPGIVLCPVVDVAHGWSEQQLAESLRHSLRKLRPILLEHGVTGYVEPLGMRGSTMKRQGAAAAAVIDVAGWDAYRICHDAFQFYRCGDTEMFPDRIGLVHISGIDRTDLAPDDLTEPDRGLVDRQDSVGVVRQLRSLIDRGYAGYISIEPFKPAVQQDPDLASRLSECLGYVQSELEGGSSEQPLAEPDGDPRISCRAP
jgi:2-keto-myo-inositol isomerase